MREPGPTFDPEVLALALANLSDAAWRAPASADDDVNPGYRVAILVHAGKYRPAAEAFGFVLAAFEPVWSAWVAQVPARGRIGPHVDQGPYHERWHVPIRPAGTFDGREVEAGASFPVAHWAPHRVDNPTDRARTHLVIDREELAGVPSAPFRRVVR